VSLLVRKSGQSLVADLTLLLRLLLFPKITQKGVIIIKKIGKWILILSFVYVTYRSFLYEFDEGSGVSHFGIPFNWLALYTNIGFSFLWIGFTLNILFFYFVMNIMMKFYVVMVKEYKNELNKLKITKNPFGDF